MVFQGEDVPLDEALEPKPDINQRQSFPTFQEWVSDGNVEQITESRNSNGFLYTVPDNFTLFITSAWVSGLEAGNVSSHGFIIIFLENPDTTPSYRILACSIDHVAGQHGGNSNNSINYSMPLRVPSGTNVAIASSAITNPQFFGGITGFLLPKKISIR